MATVQLSGIQLAFGERELLKGVSYNLAGGKKAALTGGNGTGKSTLMKIIAGLEKADSGQISQTRDCRISYLPQSGLVHRGKTLWEDAEEAFVFLKEVVIRKEELEHQLENTADTGSRLQAILEEHHRLSELILDSGYYDRDAAMEMVLKGLGFSREDFSRPAEEFSGGWQMRIALAKVLLENPDILLLDEPTNYLDIEARNWLEGFLQNFRGGLLLVSHDRYFLDVTVEEVAELFNGNLQVYKGNYTSYLHRRESELAELLKKYEQQQEEINRVEYFINKFRSNASKATQVQSRVKYLEKLERIEIPESMKKIHFTFPSPPHSGSRVLTLEGVGKAYGQHRVFRDLDLTLERGEKLLIAGKNGAGKSTLMRLIAGTDSLYDGIIKPGTDVRVGYFSQDVESTLMDDHQVIQEMEASAPTHLIPSLRNLLGAFLFRGDDIYKPVSVLSGGEKSRLALLKLLLHPVNLLVLDEPTNHLDMNSKEVLLSALSRYSGTLIFVSHDRYFIENVATRVLEMSDRGPRIFHGDYRYYLWKKEQEAAGAGGETESGPEEKKTPEAQSPGAEGGGKSAREEEKRQKSLLRRLEKEEETLLEQLENLEKLDEKLQEKLSLREVYSNGELAKSVQDEIVENKREQEVLAARWEKLEAELSSLREPA